MSSLRPRGVIPSARMPFLAAPGNTDPISIGGFLFKFLTVLIAPTTYTQIKRLASPALTLAAAIDAINGKDNVNVVKPIRGYEFTPNVVADASTATELRLRLANARGGTPTPGIAASTLLACTITAGATAWSVANLNATGKSADLEDISVGELVITAEMIVALIARAELPFTPAALSWSFEDGAGALVESDDLATIDGSSVKVVLGGGAAPSLQVGDVVHFTATK